jgi:hypothetical protein
MDGIGDGIGCLLATLTGAVLFFFITTLTLSGLIIFGVL